MKRLLAIGEALIDFIPEETGKELKNVKGFQPAVGGAPANVCGAYVKLGGRSAMITQLGDDPFGDKIVDEFVSRADVEHFARCVPYEEIVEKECTLSVNNYVEQEDTREKVDIVKLNAEIKQIVAREQYLRDEIEKIIAEIEV